MMTQLIKGGNPDERSSLLDQPRGIESHFAMESSSIYQKLKGGEVEAKD